MRSHDGQSDFCDLFVIVETTKKKDYQDDVVQDLGAAVTLLIVHIEHCDQKEEKTNNNLKMK